MRLHPARLAIPAALAVGAILGGASSWGGGEAEAQQPTVASDAVPRAKFERVVKIMRREHRETLGLRATLRHHPDFDVSLQLAGMAYGQDWRALRTCALSEGAREAEVHERHNRRPSRDGFGSVGGFQFLLGTFLSTPQGKAGMDRARQDVQAHAAAYMWSVGRRGEWYGAGC